MPKHEGVSKSVIRRLPRYYRFLGELLGKEVTRISSRELAALMKLTASQIRQDLNCFGGFGQQGYGYNVALLHKEIANILGLNELTPIILIGVGNLGRTLARHMPFDASGFKLIGLFDTDPAVIGQSIAGMTVHDYRHLDNFCKKRAVEAAMLCIPREAAPSTAEQLIANKVTCFWNFSHYDLALSHPGVIVENVHLGDSLMTLCYQINARRQSEEHPAAT